MSFRRSQKCNEACALDESLLNVITSLGKEIGANSFEFYCFRFQRNVKMIRPIEVISMLSREKRPTCAAGGHVMLCGPLTPRLRGQSRQYSNQRVGSSMNVWWRSERSLAWIELKAFLRKIKRVMNNISENLTLSDILRNGGYFCDPSSHDGSELVVLMTPWCRWPPRPDTHALVVNTFEALLLSACLSCLDVLLFFSSSMKPFSLLFQLQAAPLNPDEWKQRLLNKIFCLFEVIF